MRNERIEYKTFLQKTVMWLLISNFILSGWEHFGKNPQ